ncbi:GTP pyrophosphokinase family protein [Bacillaceae bacterium SIJ1]|uniref:GTP pyrophosphokinase n=1 Tax=Litoribacterium kuwaitense TaxID=1398745 RepID=UPI0013ED4328|nr:GTP pyrophosphokinase family protein [Litoribacterium kuwaitense]NGP44820.1 GTP pyrophosphokinase family protein [Litoribacterium kuwaitense]
MLERHHALPKDIEQFSNLKEEVTRFLMKYKFALDEMMTKIKILQEEFQYVHSYHPIEHTKSRLKSPESLLSKLQRKGLQLTLNNAEKHVHDIAGIRILCSFISDIYAIADMLQQQKDIQLLQTKDYIKKPKQNGYRSLHLLLKVPVFMSDRTEEVCVEVQIRTVAMDFWASLEHKMYYKYQGSAPPKMQEEIKEAAEQVNALDRRMERIHQEIKSGKAEQHQDDELSHTPHELIALFGTTKNKDE